MSVRKYGNKWYYDFGYEGKRHKKKGFKTKREATEAETIAKNKLIQGIVINNKSSFIDYYEEWIEVNKKNVITDKSYRTYVNAIEQFKTFLETEKLNDITLNNFSTILYRKFLKWYGADHATESVKKIHNCLKASLSDALQEGLIYKDPTYKAVVKGNNPSKPEEDKFMSATDYKKLKKYVEHVPIQSYLFIYILVITGARFGEVQKLTTDDLDFVKNTIHLRGTKTETSNRVVDVPSADMKTLKTTLNDMPININKQLFNTGVSLITNNAVTKVFQKFCLENKIGSYTLHAIRHTHCSYLLHGGVSIYYISKRLGHANIKTTLEVYSHLLEETQKEEKQKTIKLIKSM
ncbi:site-specific integrase [Staphylococcus felis]|uniref:Site-specific integrase n=1 Tax=Staphylococcus felis TaxID=46127 RepID=A0AAX1RWT6_9STAP|nr:tyrosine-type recombinase/integrase [Staphylococcus felis]REH76174.1 site-specific integrase [Staphylococcus felis]REH85312.1 site-specific integrase [Staphylococcus felis]REH86524.1 site-specific integrase [Staphylococcus felis]REH98994.1 site-specific integrase [Staphylococcus felis]REI15534.1 site-specific integrase [Staphylococcus felis]